MPLADLEVVAILGAGAAIPLGICTLVVWLNMKQQASDRAAVRAEVERAYGPGAEIQSIRAGKSDVSLVYAHGFGRYYRASVVVGGGSAPMTTLWKVEGGRCARAD